MNLEIALAWRDSLTDTEMLEPPIAPLTRGSQVLAARPDLRAGS